MGAGVKTEVWYTNGVQPGNPANEPFVAWLTKLASTDDAPSLFSMSYGDEESGVVASFAQRCNVEFQKAGARGITLLAAAGDSGAGCASGRYVPTFPASSPWITAVGGLQGGATGAESEVVWASSMGSGGGGFSDYFPRPAYQEAAVSKYLKTAGLPEARMWNHSGAGFPDVAVRA
jgi:tripeptidyl-peptidase-1